MPRNMAYQCADIRLHEQKKEDVSIQIVRLVVAMNHPKDDEALIAVAHRPELFETAKMLRMFSSFSDVAMFKPSKTHAKSLRFIWLRERSGLKVRQKSQPSMRGERNGRPRRWTRRQICIHDATESS